MAHSDAPIVAAWGHLVTPEWFSIGLGCLDTHVHACGGRGVDLGAMKSTPATMLHNGKSESNDQRS